MKEYIVKEDMTVNSSVVEFVLPEGKFCGHNCSDGENGCRYWFPNKRDGHGRQYCSYYDTYYFPYDRQGCLSYKE